MIWFRNSAAHIALIVFLAFLQFSCSNGDGSTSPAGASLATIRTVSVSWNANRETAVNAAGGGYKVYYSTVPGFAITDTGVRVVDVPFVAPPAAPTNTSLQLSSGRYYFRVVAYSTLNSPWSPERSSSVPSAQITLLVP